MEILFPAGDKQYVTAAINSKANAVYGGLKQWNCRNKATNFEINEMKDIIEYCHANNIKFYLTLNTLMLDEDIDSIINIIKVNKIIPDAIICADVGLVLKLKKELPNIPLHASTQFGVHNIDDAIFAKKLGFSRLILAREMTKTEINKLVEHTNLETEIFCWGSQCISFSGQCFLGSMVNGGTGNRGKCIILCRNKYCVNNKLCDMLYVPDLNNINLVDSKVDSLKIEGRRRDIDELIGVVNQIKNKTATYTNGYYINKDVELNKLYEEVNSRQKIRFFHNNEIKKDNNDIWVDKKEEKLFYTKLPKEMSGYLYTELKKDFKPNLYNISMELKIEKDKVKEILYINHKGESKIFVSNNLDNKYKKIKSLHCGIKHKLVNIYSIKYIKEYEGQKIKIAENLKDQIVQHINKCYGFKGNKIKTKKLNKIYIETDNINKASILSNKNIDVILDLVTFERAKSLDLSVYNSNVIFKLPMLNFDNKDFNIIARKFNKHNIMLTKISQLQYLKKYKFNLVYVDYTIPIWNKTSLSLLKEYGINRFCASPELSNDKNIEIFENEKEILFLLGGRPTCVYTRQCFKQALSCKHCTLCAKNILNKDRKLGMSINCYEDIRTLNYNNKILNPFNFDNKNVSFRYVERGECTDDLIKMLGILNSSDNYYKRLKKIKMFKNSYTNMLKEDINIEN